MKIGRRAFLASSGAFVALRARGAEKPLWTAGIVTDTHVKRTRESCDRVRMACDLFARKGVDLVINCGDIADLYYPEAYPILKEITDSAFPVKPPKKIWVYANHDWCGRKDEPWEKVFADVKRLLGGTHGFYDLIDMKGFPLLVFPQFLDFARAEKMIRDVCADPRYDGKPIILFDHVPPYNTTDNSMRWGDENRLALYSKFPRLVVVCGHAHSSLRSEQNIWQGAFSVVGMGCLAGWAGRAVGRPPEGAPSFGAVVLEAFSDRLVFRRFNVRTGREYRAHAPWTIPFPFDPATAPYRRDRAVKNEPKPRFPPDAKLELEAETPFSALKLKFPAAGGDGGTYIYRVDVWAQKGKAARIDLFGQFHLDVSERNSIVVRQLESAYFEPGERYRLRVTPCNCFGGEGRPIEADFTAPPKSEDGWDVVFESSDPMKECPYFLGKEGGKRLEAKDGWYQMDNRNFRLEFPEECWRGTGEFRFTVDMETEQGNGRTWTILLRNPKPSRNANARIFTPSGVSGNSRYVITFRKTVAKFRYCLLVREGDKGRIRFNHVKIERRA
ncbi:MAG: metallophosphoesterase [Kiritimatiellae bacterium]|nr:metallophosphoesterase [Kiritimatiellia bacterium]